MKSISKILMTGLVVMSVLAGCQSTPSMTAPPTSEPNITGTDVI
ncbi:hypothetical protein [uncultured Psychrobacter sp.]